MRTESGGSGASGAFHLKSRTGLPSAWVAPEASDAVVAVGPETPIEDAEFVALDVETNGSTPFWIIEIGAERFAMKGSLSLFDTLVDCRAPINSFARRRHRIDHDAFDTYLIGRGLHPPLDAMIFDTSSLARLILDLPSGQTPGLARVVEALGVQVSPVHAALSDAQATAAVFRELVRRGREQYGWERLGDLLAVQNRKVVDRSAIQLPRRRRRSGRGSGGSAGQG